MSAVLAPNTGAEATKGGNVSQCPSSSGSWGSKLWPGTFVRSEYIFCFVEIDTPLPIERGRWCHALQNVARLSFRDPNLGDGPSNSAVSGTVRARDACKQWKFTANFESRASPVSQIDVKTGTGKCQIVNEPVPPTGNNEKVTGDGGPRRSKT